MNERAPSLLIGAAMAIVVAALAYVLLPRPNTGPEVSTGAVQEPQPTAATPQATPPADPAPAEAPGRADPTAGLAGLLAQGRPPSGERPTAKYATEKILSLEGHELASYMEALVINVLVTIEPELEPSRIESVCSADGRSCTLTGPWPGDDFIRHWIQAIGYNEIDHSDLEGVTFESFRKVELDGSDHFSATVIAP